MKNVHLNNMPFIYKESVVLKYANEKVTYFNHQNPMQFLLAKTKYYRKRDNYMSLRVFSTDETVSKYQQ